MARSTSNTTDKAAKTNAETATATRQTTTLTGRLCADPQLRHTTSGKAVSTIRLAVNDGPEAQFYSVVVWNRTAEAVCQYLKKGRRVEVQGFSQERTWQASDGSERHITEISAFRVLFLANRTTEAQVAEQVS